MPVKTRSVEYETVVVGGAYLVKNILQRLGVVAAIDQALKAQPEIQATYGKLSQAIITNRLSLQPTPLYQMAEWAAQHGIDHVFDLQAEWLDDDRLGALLDGVAEQSVTIWTTILQNAVRRFPLALEWLHSDTTTVYFEGAYAEAQNPAQKEEHVPLLVEGYNKDGQRHKVQWVLSLITTDRVPLWYRPWDGNQGDEGVYVADMTALRQAVLTAGQAVLIGDRKLCTFENQLTFCQHRQPFLAAHPWTDTAKAVWLETEEKLRTGVLHWTPVDYVSRNHARKPPEERPRYHVCEVERELVDPKTQQVYALRWIFCHSSDKAERDAQARAQALQVGEQALQRIARLLGKYDYTDRATIEARIERVLRKAKAQPYLTYTLRGTPEAQDWTLTWQPRPDGLESDARFDGVMLLSTNVAAERLSAEMAVVKYKEQVKVEQTIDFIKSPVQIRPMWLHKPKRLVGLTLLIMIAVLVAALLEHQVRRWIAKTGRTLKGLMPEKRDNRYPTAKALLRAFADYALVIVRRKGRRPEVHWPELRPVQKQICRIMGVSPCAPPHTHQAKI